MLKSAKTSGRRIGSTIVAILNKVSFQKKNKQKKHLDIQTNPTHHHSTEQIHWLLLLEVCNQLK